MPDEKQNKKPETECFSQQYHHGNSPPERAHFQPDTINEPFPETAPQRSPARNLEIICDASQPEINLGLFLARHRAFDFLLIQQPYSIARMLQVNTDYPGQVPLKHYCKPLPWDEFSYERLIVDLLFAAVVLDRNREAASFGEVIPPERFHFPLGVQAKPSLHVGKKNKHLFRRKSQGKGIPIDCHFSAPQAGEWGIA